MTYAGTLPAFYPTFRLCKTAILEKTMEKGETAGKSAEWEEQMLWAGITLMGYSTQMGQPRPYLSTHDSA